MAKTHLLQQIQQIQKASLILALGTLLGNITSFVKSLFIARYYGTSSALDAYVLSLTPMLLISGILVGGMHAMLIPHFLKIMAEKGKKYAFSFFMTFSIGALVFVLLICIFLGLGSPFIASFLGTGFTVSQTHLTSSLLTISTILLMLTVLNEMAICLFHANKQFILPSLVPFLNGLLSLAYIIYFREQGVFSLIWGLAIGMLLQAVLILAVAVKRFLPPQVKLLPWTNADLRTGFFLMLPLLLGASFGHVNLVIDQMMASTLTSGSIAALHYAVRLHGIISQMFIMVVSRAVLPFFADHVVSNDLKGLQNTFFSTVKRSWCILLPLSLSIVFFAKLVIQVIFQRGEFSEASTIATSGAWIAYSLGLPFQATGILTARVYNALQENKTLMYVSGVGIGLNISFNWLFMKIWGHIGIALSTSAVYVVTTAVLLFLLHKKVQQRVSQS